MKRLLFLTLLCWRLRRWHKARDRAMKRLLFLTLLCWCTLGEAAQVTKWLLGTQVTVLSTELNSLASNAYSVAGATINNTVGGGTGDGYTMCDVEGLFVFGANPTPNSGVSVWFLMSADGSNFETTPTASVTLGRAPDVLLPVTQGQTTTRTIRRMLCPWGNFKTVAKNESGQAMAATANTIRIRFVTPEGISQ